MKNEVNRTLTVKKNKFTNFLSCFYANTPKNTGGGNSHSSTVVTPVWKGSRPTVSRRSTDSQRQDHRNHTPISKALKYAAMILLILTLGVGQMWAAKTTMPTSGTYNNSATKYEFSNSTTIVQGGVIWTASRSNSSLGADGLCARTTGIFIEVTSPAELAFTIHSSTNSSRTISGQLYSAKDELYYVWKKTTKSTQTLEGYVQTVNAKAAGERTTEEAAIAAHTKLKTITGSKDANKKMLIGETAEATLVTAVGDALNHTCPTSGKTNTLKVVLPSAGKYLLYFNMSGSSVGIQDITVTPKYQLTWDFDGGSTSAVEGDDYTAAGYYVEGASLTYPENSTMSKTNYIFTDWSSSATEMPASALTITAQWAPAGSVYNVNIAPMTNGSVVASPASQVEDGTVTLTVTPDDGYLLSSLSVVGHVSGGEVTVTANQFTMPAEDVTVNATFSLAPTYTVTLNPAGGTIVDATGWTPNAGNYEKKVAEGTVLTLPTFTKTDRAFKTWRKAGPADVASPVTVDGDLSLTAIWTATVENVLYSWEGAEGGAIETGGTAAGKVDNLINQVSAGYYCLKIDGKSDWSTNYLTITLSGEEKVKTGDKIKYWGFYNKSSRANARPKMRDANSPNAQIFDDGTNLPNLYSGGDPAERTFTVPASINTNAVQLTRSQTGSNTWISKLQIIREVQVEEGDLLTVTFNYNDGVTPNATIQVASGQAVAKPADPTYAHHRFNEWQLGGVAYDFDDPVTTDITLVANWTQLYTVTYAKGDESATGDAPIQADKAATETFKVAANTFELAGKVFDHWNDGTEDYYPEDTYTVDTSNVTLTAIWRTPSTMYAITKGAHENGDFTIDPASQEAGEVVTLEATPDADYLFSAWEVVKTEDGTDAGVTVTNGEFTMPAFAVTVNATFVADSRAKVLYVTDNDEAATKANDKLYAALKDIYNVSIVGYASDANQTAFDLVVLHESIGGGNYGAAAVAAAKTGNTPVLNTKSYFYNDGRWGWGAPNAGTSVKGATQNSAYCNIASHPLFDGLDVTDGFFEITDDAAAKCMQPIGEFTSGKEGYTLATTPNNAGGNGCAIHELTPAQRDAAGKYLLISVSNDKLNDLNANGQKLFQNAAAYLIGSTAWEPVNVLTSPAVAASPSAAYTVGNDIALTASATGSSATTTYTWYKGDTWTAAEEAGAIQAAATAASNGNKYGVTGCASGDAGTYWCVISNGTGCEVSASLAITVSDVSYDITFVSAHGTAPTATTGVSYTLLELTASGWEHQGWTASIDVTVDAATVTAGTTIDNGKIATFAADVTFTAVWAEIFDVTFNMQSHGASIAAQHIVDGGKATKPADPSEIGFDFGGWFTDAECTAGNEFDFNTAITAATELFAKWTAFDGCAVLVPALSGDAPTAKNQAIDLQSGSFGGAIKTAGAKDDKWSESFAYTANGFGLQKGGADSLRIELNNDMKVGTVIKVKIYAAEASSRGLYLKNLSKTTKMEMTQTEVGAKEYTYTVEEGDGLAGTNAFLLSRNNTVYLQSVTVSNCGAAITYHNLTSAVVPAGKGTVTLGASSVREGYTTTATYSEIDPLYEFVNWTVSGAGASIEDASAKTATITMGTEDAVVTLNLQRIPVRNTVTYMDGESTLGTEDVDENGHPTASEITTAKEGYIFEGWYNDAELISGPVTLSSVTITAAKTFYGKWVSDGKIRLIANGALNTTDFVTGGTLQDNASYTVEGTIYAKNVQLGNTCSNVTSIDNTNKAIFYHSQSDETKVTIVAYDNYTGGTTAQLLYAVVPEGTTSASMTTETMNKSTGGVYEVNMTGRSTLYICVGKTEVRICQIVVEEKGKANKVAPEVGYSVNLNKQRPFLAKEAATVFEGIEYYVSSAYKPLNAQVQIKTTGTDYISFTIPAGEARQLQLTTSSTSKYAVSQTKGDVTTLITPVANKAQTFNLGEGTWYINPNGSNVSITSIAFDAPQYDLNDDTNVSAILPGADVTVNNGVSLNVDVVKTINDLTIASKAGASGQITGTVTNLTIAGDLYMDVRFFESATTLNETTAGRWYMISAPFDVNLADGFYKTDGTPMVFGQTDGENIFDLFEYDGNKRATTGVTGWKRVQGKMKAGRACLIGFNPDQPTTIRLKAASTVLSEPTSITLNAYDGDDANRNWNGVANPTLHYTNLSCDVQTYNNEDGENGRKYIAYSASSTSFVVGTAFFVQATGSIDLSAATHDAFRAPQRQANERYEACVRISRSEATDFADQMYVRASENASNEYEQGHDMITWNGTTANTALIWAENYGKRLAIEEAPMVNDKATYNLGIFVPVAGTYRIEVANPNDDATLYLTKNGRIFWNLTMGACELDLAQGQNNEYGLVLRAEAPQVTTGMDEIRSEAGVQKLIIDENVFILRGEQLFDMTGKLVK